MDKNEFLSKGLHYNWKLIDEENQQYMKLDLKSNSYSNSMRPLTSVEFLSNGLNHHPDIEFGPDFLRIRLPDPSEDRKVSDLDIRLALEIEKVLEELHFEERK